MLFHEILLKAIKQTGMDKDRLAAESFLDTRLISPDEIEAYNATLDEQADEQADDKGDRK